ncbi:MAG TPA: hypothetical protein VGP72_16495 [Planctomycetota bacterium]|jgi:hypothetical protein
MPAKSTYLSDKILDHVLGVSAFSPPATVYIGLFTTLPTTGGVDGVEVDGSVTSGTDYARVAVTNDGTTWDTASSGSTRTIIPVTFPVAGADWGEVVGFGIFDAATSGNLLYFGTLNTARLILTGDEPEFSAYSLVVSEE